VASPESRLRASVLLTGKGKAAQQVLRRATRRDKKGGRLRADLLSSQRRGGEEEGTHQRTSDAVGRRKMIHAAKDLGSTSEERSTTSLVLIGRGEGRIFLNNKIVLLPWREEENRSSA